MPAFGDQDRAQEARVYRFDPLRHDAVSLWRGGPAAPATWAPSRRSPPPWSRASCGRQMEYLVRSLLAREKGLPALSSGIGSFAKFSAGTCTSFAATTRARVAVHGRSLVRFLKGAMRTMGSGERLDRPFGEGSRRCVARSDVRHPDLDGRRLSARLDPWPIRRSRAHPSAL